MPENKEKSKSYARMVDDRECGHLITLYAHGGKTVVAQWGCRDEHVACNLVAMLNHSGVCLYQP